MLGRKKTDEELGALLYEHLRRQVAGDGVLSTETLRRALETSLVGVHDQFQGEAMLGCLFAAVLAIEETTPAARSSVVRAGLENEFYRHLREQGANDHQVEEWRAVLAEHFVEYFRSVQGHTAPPLPADLGREFLWNLTGIEEEDPGLVEAATVYLMAARYVARRRLQTLLRDLRL